MGVPNLSNINVISVCSIELGKMSYDEYFAQNLCDTYTTSTHKLLSKFRELLKLAKQDNCEKVRKKKEQYDRK